MNSPEAVARRNERQKAYNEKNRDEIRQRQKQYRESNKNSILERKRLYAAGNKEKIAEWNKAYREKNADMLREYDKIRKKTPEAKAARAAAYRRFSDNFVGPKRPRRKHTEESLKAKRAAGWKAYYEKNKQRLSDRKREYVAGNRDAYLEGQKRWREKNIARRTALQAKRKARQRQAIPPWFDEFDAFVWEEAAALSICRRDATGIDWHADHMIPLAARNACGLHVAENCQVIPQALNNQKHNKMILPQPGEWIRHLSDKTLRT